MNHLELACDYVFDNVNRHDVINTYHEIELHRSSLSLENPPLYATIGDLMDEYGTDNGLPIGWWYEDCDEEDVFYNIVDRFI